MSIGFKSVTHHGHKAQQMADRVGTYVNNPYPIGSIAHRDFENGVQRQMTGQPWLDPKPVKQRHEMFGRDY